MGRQLLVSALVIMWGLGVVSISPAMMCGSMGDEGAKKSAHSHGAAQAAEEVSDAGNKICPVMGEKIDERTKATYTYKGKRYNFCCPMCVSEFKKDPERYIGKIKEEKKG